MNTPEVTEAQIEEILHQEPDADQFATKVVFLGAGLIGFCLVLSWLAPKIAIFQKLIVWLGGH